MKIRALSGVASALGLSFIAALVPLGAAAQAGGGGSDSARTPAQTHLHHVSTAFRGTPDRMGLLATALAEAEIAVQHARLAGRDRTDLAAIQRHAGHVLHALDPSRAETGPGRGYGAIRAAERTAHYVALARASVGATPPIETHSVHIETAARHASEKGTEAAELAAAIMEAEDAGSAAGDLDRLVALVEAMLQGVDADGDGRVGWQEGEGGLAQARQHLELMQRAGSVP